MACNGGPPWIVDSRGSTPVAVASRRSAWPVPKSTPSVTALFTGLIQRLHFASGRCRSKSRAMVSCEALVMLQFSAKTVAAARIGEASAFESAAALRLCSVKSAAEAQSENWVFLYRQIEAFKNAMVFVCNLKPSSQAGRRGFESHLPLH